MTSTLEFKVRECTDSDGDVVRSLNIEAESDGRRHRGYEQLMLDLGDFEARWISRGSARTFSVAQVGGEVVGFCCVNWNRSRPLLEQVFVTEQARMLGIGAAMLRVIVDHYGRERLDALSLPGDRLTKNLYERGGLKARLIVAAAL